MSSSRSVEAGSQRPCGLYLSVANYHDQKLKKCCEDGMYENPMGHSCDKRAMYIQDTKECVAAFLDCCKYIKTIRDEKQRELVLELARSKYWAFKRGWRGTAGGGHQGRPVMACIPHTSAPELFRLRNGQPTLISLCFDSPGEVDEGFLSDDDITSRSLFPESWLWQVEQLTEQPNNMG